MSCQQLLKFYEFTFSFLKIHQEPLYLGFLSPDAGPQWIPPNRVRRWCARRRKRPWRPSRRRQSRPGFPKPKVLWRLFIFSPKKKASRKWVDEDLLSFEQVFWKSLCNLNCSIFWFFQDAPLGEDLGVLGCKSLVFVEFGCATVFLWLQLMNVAT